MRATDIIRNVLDLLDAVEGRVNNPVVSRDDDSVNFDLDRDGQPDMELNIDVQQNDEPDNRFKQILAMLDADSFGPLANSPNEVVAPIEAVTTDAGGGVNGPKHPADIRVKDPGAY
jgi:hypothetical protein